MSEIHAYERDPYLTDLAVSVVEVGEHEGHCFAVLDDTILYPEGGGQPADHGQLGEVAVTDVQQVDGVLRHQLVESVATGPATLTLDWRRRFDHMQQHTAQHLLTAVAAGRFGWQTTSFHLQPEICDIELDTRGIAAGDLVALEEAVNQEVRAARSVTARRYQPEELAALGVRSRGLPEGHRGSVRVVEIAGVERNTCGGTHLRSTAEIEGIKLLGVEPKRGGSVLRWIAGGRVRQRLAAWEARSTRLRNILGASDDELADIAELKLSQLKQASRQQRALEERLAEAAAEALAGRVDSVVEVHFDDADAGLIQRVARRFAASDHSGLALLTAAGDKGCFFVVAAGGGSGTDVQSPGQAVAAALGGRGGGKGSLFQGKAETFAGRDRALEALRSKA